ncbi:MAG: MFS transporter [Alphaproteobacteria bacterium]|nr:MFS transporter [Alphaproteobacteria bacterium]
MSGPESKAPAPISSAAVDQRQPWHLRPAYPWLRLGVSLLLGTVGSSGMYVVAVVLPEIQLEFDTARMGASLPYMLTTLGFGAGGILMGRLADRVGVTIPVLLGALLIAAGFLSAAQAGSIAVFVLSSLLIGLGSSASFAPLVADTSLWFTHRRGLAVAICASGNYLSGTVWPPVVQAMIEQIGWRSTYALMGAICLAVPLATVWILRPRPPVLREMADMAAKVAAGGTGRAAARPLGMSPGALQTLLCIAGVSCCVAMAMPQVHIVALCTDLGYGPIRGAQMLSIMLACGIVSRLASGWICDRIGGLRTMALGASLQAVALVMFLPNQSLDALYLVSAIFGLVQGGIVSSYAIIVREHFPAEEAGTRVSLTITATLVGMALGGWASGAIFDVTGSYDAAFMHGIAWNLLTIAIAFFLIHRAGPRLAAARA